MEKVSRKVSREVMRLEQANPSPSFRDLIKRDSRNRLTQAELAEECGFDRHAFSRRLADPHQTPSKYRKFVLKILEVLWSKGAYKTHEDVERRLAACRRKDGSAIEYDKWSQLTEEERRRFPGPRHTSRDQLNQVPSPVVPFVGRDNELESMATRLFAGSSLVGLAGLDGMGKTELATQFVHLYEEQFPDGVVWLRMGQEVDILDQLRDWAKKYLAAAFSTDQELIKAVLSYWKAGQTNARSSEGIRATTRLIVLDDLVLQDDKSPGIARNLLEQLLGSKVGLRVLITTRDGDRLRVVSGAVKPRGGAKPRGVDVITIGPLDRKQSLELLLQPYCAARDRSAEEILSNPLEREAAEHICTLVGGMPLGLKLAGIYLSISRRPSLREYLDDLRGQILKKAAFRDLEAVIALSYMALDESPVSSFAHTLLNYAACLASAPIPRRFFVRAAGYEPVRRVPKHFERAISRLEGLGLIQVSKRFGPQEFELHQMIIDFERQRQARDLDPVDRRNLTIALEEVLIAEGKACTNEGNAYAARLYLPHLRYVVKQAGARQDIRVVELNHILSQMLFLSGYWREAAECAVHTMDIAQAARAVLEWGHHASILHDAGMLLHHVGMLDSAETCLREALVLLKDRGDVADRLVPQYVNTLALILRDEGKLEEAIQYLFDVKQDHARMDDTARILTNNSLAGMLQENPENWPKARSLYEESLKLAETQQPPDRLLIATTQDKIGALLFGQGRYREAYGYFRQALEARRRMFPDGRHPDLAISLFHVGQAIAGMGKPDAHKYLAPSLMIHEDFYGKNHPATRVVREELEGLVPAGATNLNRQGGEENS